MLQDNLGSVSIGREYLLEQTHGKCILISRNGKYFGVNGSNKQSVCGHVLHVVKQPPMGLAHKMAKSRGTSKHTDTFFEAVISQDVWLIDLLLE